MKKAILSSLFLSFSIITIGQNTNEDYYSSSSKPALATKDRISTSFMAGTFVSFAGNKSNTVSTFLAPKINYQLTTKFRLNAGIMHITSCPSLLLKNRSENTYGTNQKNYSTTLLFAGGEYQLNKKIILSGAVMANMPLNNQPKNSNYKAATVGLDYKVSKHSSIGIRATVSQGNSDNIFDNNRNIYNPSSVNSFGNMFNDAGQWGSNGIR